MDEDNFDPNDIRKNIEEIRKVQGLQKSPEIKVNVIWDDPYSKVVHKMNLFVGHYLANGFNGWNAAIKAGYSETTANGKARQLLGMPVVKKEIARVVDKKLEMLGITAEWKMLKLKEIINKCAQGEGLKDGHIHPPGVIAGISELNKMQGHYAPEKLLNLNVKAHVKDELFERLLVQFEKDF